MAVIRMHLYSHIHCVPKYSKELKRNRPSQKSLSDILENIYKMLVSKSHINVKLRFSAHQLKTQVSSKHYNAVVNSTNYLKSFLSVLQFEYIYIQFGFVEIVYLKLIFMNCAFRG